jgi:hypothetical protein
MKTVIVLYLPGHAGNFIARLFSLNNQTMPLLQKTQLQYSLGSGQPIPDDFDRLENYQFSTVPTRFNNWQQFHRSFADHKEYSGYRLLNLFCKRKFSRIVFPLHPHEFATDFDNQSQAEFYYVDLDLDQWGDWVNDQQAKLNFQYRSNEHEQFHKLKDLHAMKPISLDNMLHSEHGFVTEYHRVCDVMSIPANIEQALQLRHDWMSVRVQ